MGRILIIFIVCGYFISCSTISRKSELMEKNEKIMISAYELRGRLNDFASRFTGVVEESADEIIFQSNDSHIRQNALRWKMHSIPVSQEALFLSDPLAALIDITVFCVQMKNYLTEGDGNNLFGDFQYIAIDASKRLEGEIIALWKIAMPGTTLDLSKKEETTIYTWARKHPIESSNFIRASISDTLYAAFDDRDLGFQETIGSIAVGIYDIRNRLTLYTNIVPKQARWQAEYILNQTLEREDIEGSMNDLNRTAESLEHISDVVDQSPEILVHLENLTFKLLRSEREVVLHAIREERIAVMRDIDRQRAETLKELTNLTGETVAASMGQLEGLIDHVFWRIIQLLVVGSFLLAIGYIIMQKIKK